MSIVKVDTVVIGAGVIGLAVGRALQDVWILDQASAVATQTSSRNSGVIHAGIYYPQASYKADLCVRGRKMLYEYVRERNIGYQQLGKLIVPTVNDVSRGRDDQTQQRKQLQQLYQQGRMNGVDDLKLLTAEDVRVMEPELSSQALWSPSTGIVDVHQLCQSLEVDLEEAGGTLVLSTPVLNAKIENGRIFLQTPDTWLECDRVVNAAGLHAGILAHQMHSTTSWKPPQQRFCKGNYFQTNQKPFSRLVYPLPDPNGGLGIHATLDLAGVVRFGPDVEWLADDIHPDEIDYTPHNRIQHFETAIRAYWPALPDHALVPDYAGVRPKLQGDFGIYGPAQHKIPGLVHLMGMESPGLTSCLAVADLVADLLNSE